MDLKEKLPIDSLALLAGEELGNISKTILLDSTLIDQAAEGDAGKFKLSVNAQSAAKVKLFNDDHDDNDDALAQRLQLDDDIAGGAAFLSYAISGKLETGIGLTVKELELGIKASAEVTHTSFLRHAKTVKLLPALTDNLGKFPTVVLPASIASLKDQEAVVLATKGSFEFNGSYNLAETFTPVLSIVSKLLGTASPVKAKFELSLKFSASVALKDDLEVFIQCTETSGEKKFHVVIRRDLKKAFKAGATLGAVASFDDPKVIMDGINELIGQGEKKLIEAAEKLRDKTPVTDEQIDTIRKAAAKVGIDFDGKIEDVKKKYFEKKDDIVKKVEDAIKSNISLAATLEYERQVTESCLFDGIFSKAAIDKEHTDILKCRAVVLYEKSKDPKNGIVANEYFKKDAISVTRTGKFGLNIGDLFELSDQTKKTYGIRQESVFKDNDESQLVHVDASKISTKKMGAFKEVANSLSLQGNFQSNVIAIPTVKDLAFDFSVSWSEKFKKLSTQQLTSFLDFGPTWMMFDTDFMSRQVNELKHLVDQKVELSASLALSNGAFSKIMNALATASDPLIGSVLAACLPYADYVGRRTPEERIRAYGALCTTMPNQKVLVDPKFPEIFRQEVSDALRKVSPEFDRLATFENMDNPNSPYRQLVNNTVFGLNNIGYHFKHSFIPSVQLIKDNEHLPVSSFFDKGLHSSMLKVSLKPEVNIRILGRMAAILCPVELRSRDVDVVLTIKYLESTDKWEQVVIGK